MVEVRIAVHTAEEEAEEMAAECSSLLSQAACTRRAGWGESASGATLLSNPVVHLGPAK
jgi:hypothetical protein